ncbi:biotin--[acetyl-CoA-carboxylase] ligase [Cyclobacterium jeungdonense]|uniref:Biotin--[acetyl-CoA-carboxylase] ligase n=1 Tax=Cyclobacterium jeungdonense TaxID=708087 RepID=A0ABT8CGB0_9BACT|nr:biotin--[acetyl-CoA-carboxylase] ligase [Cyclobacterium jeungdonense]MDN3690661.1 biotin--[acetyl-CoA-carboxylase] ligase [Cyclobacterium jeungdonense]
MHKILANTGFLGKDLQILTDCHSTNESAVSRLRSGKAKEGTVILTHNQTQGRGQRGNRWHSKPGMNLTFSMVFKPDFLSVDRQFLLNMAIALGVQKALCRLVSGINIKWPNDFLSAEGKKIGGMLVENTLSGNRIVASVVGIGVNVNQHEFSVPEATSLANLSGKAYSLDQLLEILLVSVEDYYLKLKSGEQEIIQKEYLSQLYRFGTWASYEDDEVFTGKIVDVGIHGRLIITKQNGTIASYDLKQIRFI